jgi:hypothetical protein
MEEEIQLMPASEARALRGSTIKYRQQLLELCSKEIKSQALKGLGWAHFNLDVSEDNEVIDYIIGELVLRGYKTTRGGSSIGITW